MAEFLSPAWLEAMAAAAARSEGVADGLDLVIQQVVTGGPEGDVAWCVTIREGTVRVAAGRSDEPSITFTQDAGTAADIQSGEQSAQAAFMTGRLRLGGDVRLLLDHQAALATLDDLFAEVRASTTYASSGSG
jgi:putative sterol carrier protein